VEIIVSPPVLISGVTTAAHWPGELVLAVSKKRVQVGIEADKLAEVANRQPWVFSVLGGDFALIGSGLYCRPPMSLP